jgi:hypothetical protein
MLSGKLQQLDDWGNEGPVFGPLSEVHGTYGVDISLNNDRDELLPNLNVIEGCVYYAGTYYGDWTVFTCSKLLPVLAPRRREVVEKDTVAGQFVLIVDDDACRRYLRRTEAPGSVAAPQLVWDTDVEQAVRFDTQEAATAMARAVQEARRIDRICIGEIGTQSVSNGRANGAGIRVVAACNNRGTRHAYELCGEADGCPACGSANLEELDVRIGETLFECVCGRVLLANF